MPILALRHVCYTVKHLIRTAEKEEKCFQLRDKFILKYICYID